MALGLSFGAVLGVGGYTFLYAKGASYMTNRPEACANCHIMQAHYDAWIKSSHARVAVCNDCHTPAGFIGKYSTKALNGFWHSLAFTTGVFHDPIAATPRNHAIAEASCRKCHTEIVSAIESHAGPAGSGRSEEFSCGRCHDSVGHATR
jgi:cytochrome c nitrite reductase small subunit